MDARGRPAEPKGIGEGVSLPAGDVDPADGYWFVAGPPDKLLFETAEGVQSEMDGFPVAHLLPPAPDIATSPGPWGIVENPAEVERLLSYLRAGAPTDDSAYWVVDVTDPRCRFVVRGDYRTDGEWVWPASVKHYLQHHGFAPEPGLREHIAGRGYRCPPVSPGLLDRVRAAATAYARRRKAWFDAQQVPPPPLPGDGPFPRGVAAVLRRGGWFPGRDVSDEVEPWIAQLLAEEPSYAGRPAAVAAGRRFLREFGNVWCDTDRLGPEAVMSEFGFFPETTPGWLGLIELSDLELDAGRPLFPVGFSPQEQELILIAPDDQVYVQRSSAKLQAGSDPVAAIIALVEGRPLPRVSGQERG
jgi:SUKH-3 immunity protein